MPMRDQARMLLFVKHVRCCDSRIDFQNPCMTMSQDKIDSENSPQSGLLNNDPRGFQNLSCHLLTWINRTDVATEQES